MPEGVRHPAAARRPPPPPPPPGDRAERARESAAGSTLDSQELQRASAHAPKEAPAAKASPKSRPLLLQSVSQDSPLRVRKRLRRADECGDWRKRPSRPRRHASEAPAPHSPRSASLAERRRSNSSNFRGASRHSDGADDLEDVEDVEDAIAEGAAPAAREERPARPRRSTATTWKETSYKLSRFCAADSVPLDGASDEEEWVPAALLPAPPAKRAAARAPRKAKGRARVATRSSTRAKAREEAKAKEEAEAKAVGRAKEAAWRGGDSEEVRLLRRELEAQREEKARQERELQGRLLEAEDRARRLEEELQARRQLQETQQERERIQRERRRIQERADELERREQALQAQLSRAAPGSPQAEAPALSVIHISAAHEKVQRAGPPIVLSVGDNELRCRNAAGVALAFKVKANKAFHGGRCVPVFGAIAADATASLVLAPGDRHSGAHVNFFIQTAAVEDADARRLAAASDAEHREWWAGQRRKSGGVTFACRVEA